MHSYIHRRTRVSQVHWAWMVSKTTGNSKLEITRRWMMARERTVRLATDKTTDKLHAGRQNSIVRDGCGDSESAAAQEHAPVSLTEGVIKGCSSTHAVMQRPLQRDKVIFCSTYFVWQGSLSWLLVRKMYLKNNVFLKDWPSHIEKISRKNPLTFQWDWMRAPHVKTSLAGPGVKLVLCFWTNHGNKRFQEGGLLCRILWTDPPSVTT